MFVNMVKEMRDINKINYKFDSIILIRKWKALDENNSIS
jgi:hypothetical protein